MDLLTSYSNRPDIADDLAISLYKLEQASRGSRSIACQSVQAVIERRRTDLLADRLSDDDERQLVASFKSGTPKWQLAEQYKVSESSVKRLLRKHGVRMPSGHPRRIDDHA